MKNKFEIINGAINDIVADICDRRDWKHMWNQTDCNVRLEIIMAWEKILGKHLEPVIKQPVKNNAINFRWEYIDMHTERAKVCEGWLVRYTDMPPKYHEEEIGYRTTMVFVPDAKHEWEIK